MTKSWDRRFIRLAAHIASWAKDPSTKVGAVIVRPDRTIVSHGYNGFPRGVRDIPARLDDRPTKYAMTVHAELNAILTAKEPLNGYTLYVTPLFPCANCAGAIIQSGIKRIVYDMPGEMPEHWRESFNAATAMFLEAGVRWEQITNDPTLFDSTTFEGA